MDERGAGATGEQDAILRHYEHEIREEDRIASGARRLELVRTQEILRRHLPKPPAAVSMC